MSTQPATSTRLLPIGAEIHYGTLTWRVGAIAWLGERYYFLVRGSQEVAMIPAVMVEEENKEQLIEIN